MNVHEYDGEKSPDIPDNTTKKITLHAQLAWGSIKADKLVKHSFAIWILQITVFIFLETIFRLKSDVNSAL